MIDKFKEISSTLNIIINLLKEFDHSKDDFKKPLIRSYQQQLLSLGKIIDDSLLEKTTKLSNDIDLYLSNPKKKEYLKLIDDAVNLNNSLWEL
jgi:hypothetical protein